MTDEQRPDRAPGPPAAPIDKPDPDRLGLPPVDKARLERSMRGIYSALLILEAIVVMMVPVTISRFGVGLTGFRIAAIVAVIAGLIVLCVFMAGSWAYAAGWVLQACVFAMGFWTWAMFVLGALFAAMWYAAGKIHRDLRARPDLVG